MVGCSWLLLVVIGSCCGCDCHGGIVVVGCGVVAVDDAVLDAVDDAVLDALFLFL